MAVGYLPEPGSEYAPCEEECEHSDCPDGRIMMAAVCTYCKEPIAQRGFYDEYYDEDRPTGRHDYYIHAHPCFWDKVDNS